MKDLPAVVSYWRSGTHWLCSLMYQWFYYGKLGEEQLIQNSILPFRVWHGDNAASYPWAKLLGGHIYDPDSAMAKKLQPRKIIYLYRNYHEVLPSLWRLRMVEAAAKGWPIYTFPQFLRMRPVATDDGNTWPPVLNVRDLCEWSQNKWVAEDRRNGVCVVFYSDMIEDLEAVRDRISVFLDRSPCKLQHDPARRVGYTVPQGQHNNDELWEMVT